MSMLFVDKLKCLLMGMLPVARPRAVSQCFMGSLGGKQTPKLEGEYKYS